MSGFDDRDGYIWINGELKPWREACIHVLSHGLHYGSSVFEGERIYDGNIFKEQEHTQRLIRSAELIDMPIEQTAQEIIAARHEVIAANKITNGYIRPVAWRGSEQLGIAARQTRTHLAIACWEWPSYFSKEQHEKGIRLIISDWRTPAPDTAPVESKAGCLYATHTMSKHMAERKGFDDALMLDYRGLVAEATGANFFMLDRDGILKTPVPDCFLNGLTRQTVIALAGELKIKVEETRIKPEDLNDAQEIFLTGTAAEIIPVGQVADMHFEVGPVTKQIAESYHALVRHPAA